MDSLFGSHLCKRYGRKVALDSVDLQIEVGESIVLLGPNGAGKSTLLKILAGVMRPTSGAVGLDGGRLPDSSLRELRRRVAWMPQTVTAIPRLTAFEQVVYAGWLAGMREREARAAAPTALASVGLSDQSKERAANLSGGQLRRLGLAECLVRQGSYLLLDEPTAGLDPAQRKRFREVLMAVNDVGVVVSTHETHDVADIFDRVIVLVGGGVVFDGTPQGFMSRADTESMEEAYATLVGGS